MKDFIAKLRGMLPHKTPVFIALVVFIALFVLFQCAKAAELPHTRFDAGARIGKGEAAYITVSAAYPGPTANTHWEGGLLLLGASNDDEYGYTRNNLMPFGMLVATRWRVSLGLGLGHWIAESPYSGTRTQAVLLLRVRLFDVGKGSCSVQHLHASNASIKPPNPGWELPGFGCTLQW
jgi:hypothetical protein